MSALNVKGLKKSWPDFRLEASFSASDGAITSLLGPSGCGKTSTLRLIAGLDSPSSGDILLDGRSILMTPTEERNIGFVFQDYALFPHLSVFENIAFGLRVRGKKEKEIEEKVSSLLSLTHLSGIGERSVLSLSGGEKQRVALARALAIEPSLLLLDEPLSSVDINLRKKLRSDIQKVQKSLGITTIYVTHDREEALSISDSVVLMNKGRVEQQGSPDDVYSSPNDEFVAGFTGPANILDAEAIPGGFVSFHGASFRAGSKKLGPVKMMFRPEDSSVSLKRSAHALELTLESVSFSQCSVEFLFEGNMRSVMLRRELEFDPEEFTGKRLYLTISRLHVF